MIIYRTKLTLQALLYTALNAGNKLLEITHCILLDQIFYIVGYVINIDDVLIGKFLCSEN